MDQHTGLWLVVNAASGSNSDEALERLQDACTVGGCTPGRIVDIREDGPPSREGLEAAGVGTLAVYTGDGSVNAVVTGLEGWGGQVLVLPGGTANLLARALHGDAPAEEIIGRFVRGELHRVRRGCIRSAHGTALIELLAGPGALWSDVREELREGSLGDVATKAIEAVRESTGGPKVCLVDPQIGLDTGYAGVRLEPDEGGLIVEGYEAQGPADYLKQGIALIRRNFREGPHDELGLHPEVHCRSSDGSPIALMLDGERSDGTSEERFSLATLGVDLLASQDG